MGRIRKIHERKSGKREELSWISSYCYQAITTSYVVLAMAEKNEVTKQEEFSISCHGIDLANKLWINQLKKDGSFHFKTTGRIFGLGYGPKYLIDEKTNLSIGQFASKKKKK